MNTIKSSFKCCLLLLFSSFVFSSSTIAQSCYNQFIDSIISGITMESVCKIVHELTGDTATIIGGVPYTILSRAYNDPGNQMAAQYIFEKFESFGLNPRFQTFSITGKNVIAVKAGVKYPNKQFIICGHYDSYPWQPRSIGADDDATGVCGVLEAARILTPYNFDYTIIFIGMDEEERGLYGSHAYVDTAAANGDSIMAVINLDMIAYDANQDGKLYAITNSASLYYANVIGSSFQVFEPTLTSIVSIQPGWGGSDHYSFWQRGYNAVWPFEHDMNPYVNSMLDTITLFNFDYFLKMTRGAVASLAVLAGDYIINFTHDPIESTTDTTARVATVVITSSHPIAKSNISKKKNGPRLYWKTGTELFTYKNAFYTNLDTFKFLIPGQPVGSTIYYYISAQDSLGTMVGSLPGGAIGINPPGTIPPPYPFVYRILRQANFCSNTLPKPLLPMQMTYDTVHISQTGIVYDYDLNLTIHHQYDSLLYIWLLRPGLTMVALSTANGGSGENYLNTTFDDEASIPITEGVPPFTGTYRPESPLSAFDSFPLEGEWVLRVYNFSTTLTGELNNWCLNFGYFDPIGIVNKQVPMKSSLSQNYPNPFNSSTKISFSLNKKSFVRIIVYDVLGREVRTLINDLMDFGEHNLSLDANNFASGLYFYTMFLDGNLFETKKMVLIK
jgi:Peptidase family M28/Secretion system C-terminal sorting domain/Proprotein convertase P-domain